MKKVLSRCLVLALVLCLVCSSCLAEGAYEAIKAYINNSSAGKGTSIDVSGKTDFTGTAMLNFTFKDSSIWVSGKNTKGDSELTLWYPSIDVFTDLLIDCLEKYDDFADSLSAGYQLVIAVTTLESEDDPIFISDSDLAHYFYEALTSSN